MMFSWEPINFASGTTGPGRSSDGVDVVVDAVKDHGWPVCRFVNTTDDDDLGSCSHYNFLEMKNPGIACVFTHGSISGELIVGYFKTKLAAQIWTGAPEAGMSIATSALYPGYYVVYVKREWLASHWKSFRDANKGITIFGVCYGAATPIETSSLASSGGRFMVGYSTETSASKMEQDMTLLLRHMNGQFAEGAKRTAKKALSVTGYNSNLIAYGHLYTTLGPSPVLAENTKVHDGVGSGVIVFDTYIRNSISTIANNAVVYTSNGGSDRRWVESNQHKYAVSYDFSSAVPGLEANADECRSEANIGLGVGLSGDRVNYFSNLVW